MSELDEKSDQVLRIQQNPAGSWANASSALQNLHSLACELINRPVHIGGFKQHVMNPLALDIQEFAIGISSSLKRLNQFQLERTGLNECLADLNALLLPMEPVLCVRTVRPLNKMKWSQAENRVQ